jgi:hypothetical protein
MKLQLLPTTILCLATLSAPAQQELNVIERGPNHKVIERTVEEVTSDGRIITRPSRYTAIASGMNVLENGMWREVEEKFELIPGGAVARGHHQVTISGDFQANGVVDLVSSDGRRFRSHLLGLAYTELTTAQSVLFAEPQACAGELVAPNVILFRDAFAGPARCDVRYTFTRGGFSQDVICRSRLPDPAQWGMDKTWTRIEVWSVVDAEEPSLREQTLAKPEEWELPMFDAGMSDETLQWGSLRIGPGRAFMLNDEDDSGVVVAKNLVVLDQTRFLVEKLDYVDVEDELQNLPLAAANLRAPAALQARVAHPSRNAALTAAWRRDRQRRERQEARAGVPGEANRPEPTIAAKPQILLAGVRRANEPGLVIDYQTINVNTNSAIFRRDTTYFVVGNYTLSGTNIIEGSTVIKATNANLVGRLTVTGTVLCETDRARPAFFTSWQDNTVGEPIAGSSGHPTNACGIYLDFTGNTTPADLHDLRLRHGYMAIRSSLSGSVTIRHSQFSSNFYAVGTGHGKFRNVLVHDCTYVVGGQGTWTFENSTFHRVTNFRSTYGTNSSYLTYATNCLIVAVTNFTEYFGAYNVRDSSDAGYFQSVGSAAHYLISGSTNRDSATTNIDSTLVADLKRLTTWPPIVLTNHFTNDTVLTPQAPRDADGPDMGFHYTPLDWCWTGLKVSNARLTLTNEVAIGLYGDSASYGIGLDSGGELVAAGLPHRMARILRNNLAQEHASGAWSASSVAPLVKVLTNAPVEPRLQWRFVESVLPAGEGHHLYGWHILNTPFGYRDCLLAGGRIQCSDVGIALTNCVIDRVDIEYEANNNDSVQLFHHNLVRGGRIYLSLPWGGYVEAKNNLFDRTTIGQFGIWTHGWNAYFTNQATGQHITNSGATDKFLTSVGFETGALGWYYYPTNGGAGSLTDLVNAGSTNAQLLSFYHYTSATNQTKEATSLVDIGFRYIAVDGGGIPVDTDYPPDGWWDWWEDSNGNGSLDSGETDWSSTGDQGFRVWITRPRRGSSVP